MTRSGDPRGYDSAAGADDANRENATGGVPAPMARPPELAVALEGLALDSDKTMELPLVLGQDLLEEGVGEEGAIDGAAAKFSLERPTVPLPAQDFSAGKPAPAASVMSVAPPSSSGKIGVVIGGTNAPTFAAAPSELHGETPTAPLPVDDSARGLEAQPGPPAAEPSPTADLDAQGAAPAEAIDIQVSAEVQLEPEEPSDDVGEVLEEDLELVDGATGVPAVLVKDPLAMDAAPRPTEPVGATVDEDRDVRASSRPPQAAVASASASAPITAVVAPPASAPRPSAIPPMPPPEALRPTEAWSEPLSQRPRKKRLKPWFEEVFDEDYLRTLPFMTAEQTLREVSFLKEQLSPPADGELLDVACGYGRHAIELAQRGLKVTGIDLSLPLLIRAADESQRRALSVNFVHADMRELSFDAQFDGAYCMLTSFGYFDEDTNLKVAAGIHRALKPGGRFVLDAINRDYIVGDLPTRVWWEGDGCLVLEEVDFSFHTSRLAIRRSVVFQDGRQLEHDISIRAYSLHELGKLMRQAGFRVLDVSGSIATKGTFFGATSRNLIMLCEKAA